MSDLKAYNRCMDPVDFLCHTLREQSWGEKVTRILSAGLDAVEPRSSVSRALSISNDCLLTGGQSYSLHDIDKIFLIGFGKAGVPMARAVMEVLSEHISTGLVITKDGHSSGLDSLGQVKITEASHPLPDERAVLASQEVKEILSGTSISDLVISLISGGGSALFTSPVSGITLDDLKTMTRLFLESGASIQEINVLRKHVDELKGGGLSEIVYPARLISLILSDVVGDNLDSIASGPTVPDPSTYADAIQILAKYQLKQRMPESIIGHLERGQKGEIPETPKQGSKIFNHVQNVIVGNNETAARSALKKAENEGFVSKLVTSQMQGEARIVGDEMGKLLVEILETDQEISRPFCLVAGGETTVTLHGNGMGGRNQEIALASVFILKGIPDIALLTLATDGGDGPTDSAGAVVTGETFNRAKEQGMDPLAYLDNNDSYTFFNNLGDTIKTGPTQTNVNDLLFLFAF